MIFVVFETAILLRNNVVHNFIVASDCFIVDNYMLHFSSASWSAAGTKLHVAAIWSNDKTVLNWGAKDRVAWICCGVAEIQEVVTEFNSGLRGSKQ